MPVLLSDAIAQLPNWTLCPFKAKDGQMQIATVRGSDGSWPAIQLLPMDCMGEITTPFAPSAYRGTGNEPRKGIVFQVPDAVALAVAKSRPGHRSSTRAASGIPRSRRAATTLPASRRRST